jgi:hypothetical protein
MDVSTVYSVRYRKESFICAVLTCNVQHRSTFTSDYTQAHLAHVLALGEVLSIQRGCCRIAPCEQTFPGTLRILIVVLAPALSSLAKEFAAIHGRELSVMARIAG